MNVVTPIKLPDTLPAGCLNSATVGKWNTSLLEWATPKFLPLLTKGLSHTIELSRSELLQNFSTFDSDMETHLYKTSYSGDLDSPEFVTSLALHLKDEEAKFRVSLNTPTNKASLTSELFRVKQYWVRVEQELLTFLRATLAVSIKPQFSETTCMALYASILQSLVSTSAQTRQTNRNNFFAIRLKDGETVDECYGRILDASAECAIAGEPTTPIANFQQILSALPES